MTNLQSPYKINNNKEIKKYKRCDGRDCNGIGDNPLKIIYINKIGWFCDPCKSELLNLKLVVEE
ncbi:hypothetical protein BH23THE1_BH23THE1_13410 [soil metagenome]